jgi:antitoxin component YwqK of YwqJK toxin-antitoxin module
MADDDATLSYDDAGRLRARIPLLGGRPHGVAETFDADGTRLRAAPFVDGVLQGELVEDEPATGRRVVYTFKAGVLDGPARIDDHGRPLVTMAFAQGKLEGPMETFDPATGAKLTTSTYRAGMLDGPSIVYAADGSKQRESHFRQGLLEGDVVEYGPDGEVRARQHYQAGLPVAAPAAEATVAGDGEPWFRRWARRPERARGG